MTDLHGAGNALLASAAAGRRVESLLSGSFLVFGALAILLAPLALALAKPGPGGEGWTILTLLCCTFAAGFFFFASDDLSVTLVAWLLAWTCAMIRQMSFRRLRA
jgi:hypothetical protein